jgi:hypothetical protein
MNLIRELAHAAGQRLAATASAEERQCCKVLSAGFDDSAISPECDRRSAVLTEFVERCIDPGHRQDFWRVHLPEMFEDDTVPDAEIVRCFAMGAAGL